MFPIILGLSCIKSIGPFLRHHVLESISIAEFLFVTSVLIMLISFMYAYVHRRESFSKLFRLSHTQYSAIVVISIATILSGFAIVKLEEMGILSSIFVLRAASSIFAILVGVFIFEETLTMYQSVGIMLAFLSAAFLIQQE